MSKFTTPEAFNSSDIPSQQGRLALVTGANSGIGYEAALRLAQAGAEVILACRSEARAQAALKQILEKVPAAKLSFRALDLADLASIEAFATKLAGESKAKIDLLILNAGVMMPATRQETKDGFELQFGVNHLGHFALTAQLFASLAPEARITVVSSNAHKSGRLSFDDLQWISRPYKRWNSYGDSKLANLLFVSELQRRLVAKGSKITATGAHPGWTSTNLGRHAGAFKFLSPLMGMRPEQGALPTLHAATSTELGGGEYLGPRGLMEMRGNPVLVDRTKEAKDEAVAARLWESSEALTGVRFEALAVRSAKAPKGLNTTHQRKPGQTEEVH